MKKTYEPTKASAIRLPISTFAKLRELMQAHGRIWLERVVIREHRKLEQKSK